MAAVTITTAQLGVPDTYTGSCPTTSNYLRQVNLPERWTWCAVVFVGNDGFVTHTGTDEAAVGTHYLPCAAGELVTIPLGRSTATRSLYVGSAVGSTVYHLMGGV